MIWYIPTYFGDILLKRLGPKQTELRLFELTETERAAVELLRQKAIKQGLALEREFAPLCEGAYRTAAGLTVKLEAPIGALQKFLAKALKPGREQVSAVRFSNGNIHEIHDPEALEPQAEAPPSQPEVAATVSKPVKGCPMPIFEVAEQRANRVLQAFLTPEQGEDYLTRGYFISEGADTGHRYVVIHRERPEVLRRFGGRQLYDLDDKQPLCVHDWEVPPPEEMLALHLSLILPGQESELRLLPVVWEDVAGHA